MNEHYNETHKVSSSADWSNLRDVVVKDHKREITHYKDIVAAIRDVGTYWVLRLRGDMLRPKTESRYDYLAYIGDTHIFYTAEGIRIPVWKLHEVAQVVANEEQTRRIRRWRHRRFKFRQGPVEGIRCWRGGGGWFRDFSTQQEIRENDFLNNYDEEAREYNIKSRGRRRRGAIPTKWDDYTRSDWGHNNWKRQRRHQYKDR